MLLEELITVVYPLVLLLNKLTPSILVISLFYHTKDSVVSYGLKDNTPNSMLIKVDF